MNTLELFCGTKSFSKVAAQRGCATLTVDNDPQFTPDICANVQDLNLQDLGKPDIIWASPPCQGFSVARIGRNWHHDGTPKTNTAREAIELVKETLYIIGMLKPMYFFIENPRAMLRKLPLMKDMIRHTVTYCQYGDKRMKPTDIWTNCEHWKPRPMCKNGAPCHVAAPRGSRTGTQGLKNAVERGAIPPALFEEIFDSIS